MLSCADAGLTTTLLGLMRVRGAQCRARYAEAFTVEKSVLDSGSDYSVN